MLAPYMVPLIGVEPIRYHYHRILSPARLPIPPQRRVTNLFIITHFVSKINPFFDFFKFFQKNSQSKYSERV